MSLPTRVNRALVVDPFETAGRDFDNVLTRLFGGRDLQANGGGWAPYGVDVREDADHLYVEAELPGYKKEEVNVTLENQTLTISAEHNAEKSEGQEKGDWLLRERRYNRFLRSFTLPPTVDEQKVDAKLTDGVLKVTLNKREETKPRRIPIG